MNEELAAAEEKIRAASVEYLRAAMKLTGSAEIAVLMFAKELGTISESFTEADFKDLEGGVK